MKYLKLSPIVLVAILYGCANLMPNFDQNSYETAVQLKSDSLRLIAFGSDLDSPAIHQAEIVELQVRLSSALAYERGKFHNKLSADQWETLVSPNANLLGHFLEQWKNGYVGSKIYVQDKIDQIGLAWDEIIKLEGSKTK